MKQNETKTDEKGTKTDEIFHCKNCDYITSHIGHWKRHLETKKHKKFEMKQIKFKITYRGPASPRSLIINHRQRESAREQLCLLLPAKQHVDCY